MEIASDAVGWTVYNRGEPNKTYLQKWSLEIFGLGKPDRPSVYVEGKVLDAIGSGRSCQRILLGIPVVEVAWRFEHKRRK